MSNTKEPVPPKKWAMDLARGLCGNCHGKGFTQVDGTFRSFRFECADCQENAHALERVRNEALEEAARVCEYPSEHVDPLFDCWNSEPAEVRAKIRALIGRQD